MKFCILPISTKISQFSASGLILINLHPSSFFVLFLFHFLFFHLFQYVLFRQLLLLIYAQESINQFKSKTVYCGRTFSFENVFNVFIVTDSSLLIVISCNVNPNLHLKSCIFFRSFFFHPYNFLLFLTLDHYEHTKVVLELLSNSFSCLLYFLT